MLRHYGIGSVGGKLAFPENSQIRLLFQQHGQEQRPDPPVSMIRGDAQVIQQGPARPPQPQKTGTNNLIAVKQAPGAVEPSRHSSSMDCRGFSSEAGNACFSCPS